MWRALAVALLVHVAPPTRWVTDDAQALTPTVRETLDRKLEAFEHATGHQVVVYLAPSTGGEPVEDWSARTFAQWKVGRKGLDDGVALFVFTGDRTARIEVGYGLEAVLTDVTASRILRQALIPRMAAKDVDGAVTATVDAITAQISAGPPPQAAPRLPRSVKIAGGIIAVVLFVALAIWQPQLAWLLLMLLTGRRRGGGGGGGGFSGGGGRSGGAGASGGW